MERKGKEEKKHCCQNCEGRHFRSGSNRCKLKNKNNIDDYKDRKRKCVIQRKWYKEVIWQEDASSEDKTGYEQMSYGRKKYSSTHEAEAQGAKNRGMCVMIQGSQG